jgi:hypothetical protein
MSYLSITSKPSFLGVKVVQQPSKALGFAGVMKGLN